MQTYVIDRTLVTIYPVVLIALGLVIVYLRFKNDSAEGS
jgi:hypothetical protein